MKSLFRSVALKVYLMIALLITGGISVFAQDSGSSNSSVTTTHSESQTWYTQPWVWIVGGAVFILLLIALVRGSNTSEKVTVTKTETTEV